MRRTLTTTTAALFLAGLAACSSNPKPAADAKAGPASQPLTASSAFAKVSASVASAKLSGTVTAENDPNHLLGRPSQYTSKVTFADSRIKAADISGTKEGDVERGGAIEVFGSEADAQTRAKYIQAVTKSLPALAEYDYVHGSVLVRVSHYLTPAQAAGYESAAAELG
ncbi:hypothetical protein STRTUCAR8_08573 [Streptomyces turgidiscabies Car8]|uniref:Lipoprotein n=1 Tax=Streptomyces turgidiscabies (strain Car8) TaxID=698760 RepID=L7FAH8_STRT8|nr:hypothetical protein [Streptomyces turgidiscabies]ELP67660.1 hypothetical protein STRTUCAR8_08573 [Streptomyces turgidiscabies Car8]